MAEFVEKVRLGGWGEGVTRQRADGKVESCYHVYEAHGRPKRPGVWGRIMARAGAAPPQPVAQPRQPGRVWHGFSAEGGPISELVVSRDGKPVWSLHYSPPTYKIDHTRAFGVDWALDLLGYYDVTMTIVHAPWSKVAVRETWSS